MWILVVSAAVTGAAILGGAYYCYRRIFTIRQEKIRDPYYIPSTGFPDKWRPNVKELVGQVLELPFEEVYVTSYDGLRLYGRYYEQRPGAPVQILFHGYRCNAHRDFCGGLQLALKTGCNALLVDQRAHCHSEGKCLSFGIKERQDCLTWIEYIRSRCGAGTPIVLEGISMGATTVLMAAGLGLPENVKGIIGDCGYTSPRDIIRKVMVDMGFPVALYPLIRLGAWIFGNVHLEECSAPEALTSCGVPVLLIHGEDDDFVPCEMSRRNQQACAARCTLLTVPGGTHGTSYIANTAAYCEAVMQFLTEIGIPAGT